MLLKATQILSSAIFESFARFSALAERQLYLRTVLSFSVQSIFKPRRATQMPSLESSDQSIITGAIGPICIIHEKTVARLYRAEGNGWGYTGIVGAVCILTDPTKAAHFIKIVDLTSQKVVFSQELYENFTYQSPTSFFHTFETDQFVAGLSFAEEGESVNFQKKVEFCRSNPLAAPPGKSNTPAGGSSKGKDKKKDKKPGFFKKLFGGKESKSSANFTLSDPRGFKHVSHAGWNADQGIFEINNIPAEWKQLFQTVGIKENELTDKRMAPVIYNELMGGAAPPPPPGPGANSGAPKKMGTAPPPPPNPNGGGGMSAAAPPPPPPPPPGPGMGGAPKPPPSPRPPVAAPPQQQQYQEEYYGEEYQEEYQEEPIPSSNSLASQIHKGIALKKVEKPADNGGDVNPNDFDLQARLRSKIEALRAAMGEGDDDFNNQQGGGSDDWSDDE